MNLEDIIRSELIRYDPGMTNIEKTGWYLLLKEASHLKNHGDISTEDARQLTDIFSCILKMYNPSGWEGACDTFIHNELFGWSKKESLQPAYLNIGVNRQLLYKGIIADLAADENVNIPEQSWCRFRLFIDPEFAVAGINLIWLADPETNNIFSFGLFHIGQ